MTGPDLLLRLIASWGGFGWERVRERYEQIVPPGGLNAYGALEQLRADDLVDRLRLTDAGRKEVAIYTRAHATGARVRSEDSETFGALLSLVQALQPVACEIFEFEHHAQWERVSVALDVAAAAVGVDLNPRDEPPDGGLHSGVPGAGKGGAL